MLKFHLYLCRCAFLFLLCFVFPQGLHARSYSISQFHADITLHKDSSISVHEKITFKFEGAFNGVFRTIPVKYDVPWGGRFGLRLKVINVSDDLSNDSLKYEVSSEGRNRKIKIWVPGAQDTAKTVDISYVVWRAMKPFNDHDELYWNVTGNEWDVPMDKAETSIGWDMAIPSSEFKFLTFTGPAGSRASDAVTQRYEKHVDIAATHSLAYREGMTVVIGWPKGQVDYPGKLQNALWFIGDNPILFLPLGVFALCFLVWWLWGRDGAVGSVAPEYEPPEGFGAAELGSLIDDSVDTSDISALCVDLAVRGYLEIGEMKDSGFFNGRDISFRKLKDYTHDATLKPFEVYFLTALFSDTDVCPLENLRNTFYTDLQSLKRQIESTLVSEGYYFGSPSGVRQFFQALGVGPIGLGVGLWLMGSYYIWGCTLILSGIIVWLFGRIMPRKTPKGIFAMRKVLGFQEFLSRAEKDRIARLPPDTFHKWLPYAMALGVTAQWTKTFEGLAVAAPTWYVSSDPFNPMTFGYRMNHLSTRMGTTFASTPRQSGSGSSWSSGGSGFGGGGSSGGGAGGGGGGTF